jgi:hypothetical protein
MIAHNSIGVRDIDRSKRLYDAALEPLGYKCLRAARTLPGYGYGRDSIALWAANAADVDALHAAALRCGGHDNGAPGKRLITAPTTTPPSSSIRTDTGSRRITVQQKSEVS